MWPGLPALPVMPANFAAPIPATDAHGQRNGRPRRVGRTEFGEDRRLAADTTGQAPPALVLY
ncbi:hypothetical protein C0Z19_06165 [Trinickia soli]|uniref:Uncharacterized protein n=1 Tax=Trinickia soli TaxID=380675 RepID=A0A2N7WAW1_9BURK|nr:hypothetical protein C0Z19_06165 [Trinickia soli]